MNASGNDPGAAPVFVTGATGFVGSALVRELVAAGREVHAIYRAGSPRHDLEEAGPVWYEASLEDECALEVIVRIVTDRGRRVGRPAELVHAAAKVSYRRRDAELSRRTNVEGTRTLLDAWARHAGGRFLFVSSVVAIGVAESAANELDELATFRAPRSATHYVSTKRAAERIVLNRAPELDVTVVNPGAVYGPSQRPTNMLRFLERVASGGLGPLAPPGSLSVVGLRDVARGIRLVLEHGARGERTILTTENLTVRELIGRAALAFDRPAPRATCPKPLWRALVQGARLVDRVRPLEHATPAALGLLGEHLCFSSAKARRLGWVPRPFAEVLAETIGWMRSRSLA